MGRGRRRGAAAEQAGPTHVITLGQRRILFIEGTGKGRDGRDKDNEHRHLIAQLQREGKAKFEIAVATPNNLPANKEELGVFLSRFDCVVLANVPAPALAQEQMTARLAPASCPSTRTALALRRVNAIARPRPYATR